MKKLLKILIYFSVITFVIGGILNYFDDNNKADDKEIDFNYKTLPIEKVGLPSQNRATQKLIVKSDSIIAEENLKELLVYHWNKQALNNYNEFTLFVYFEDMNTSESAYCVAEFNKEGVVNQFLINKSSLIGTKWKN